MAVFRRAIWNNVCSFGSVVSTVVFFTVAIIQSNMGVPPAPSAITDEHIEKYNKEQNLNN